MRKFDYSYNRKTFSYTEKNKINRVYVINLDRKPLRWKQLSVELKRIILNDSSNLLSLTRRFSAVDARYLKNDLDDKLVISKYSLADQLSVEPNTLVSKNYDTKSIFIEMSKQEIAIALSHIEIWRLISKKDIKYTLILEDDIYFVYGFNSNIDNIWQNVEKTNVKFDILFLSYEYVKSEVINKSRINNTNFLTKPERGIWQASGYVLSKEGAKKLLNLLPVKGPVDLWLNQVFKHLIVYIAKEPIIKQRIDVPSSNSYSIMPIFSKLGIYNGNDQANYKNKKIKNIVFVFGEEKSGLTSIAIALLILGYTCCYNIDDLPESEFKNFRDRKAKNSFNAYVNISSLYKFEPENLLRHFPNSKIIYTTKPNNIDLNNSRILFIAKGSTDKWEMICKFLGFEYPAFPFPEIEDQDIHEIVSLKKKVFKIKELKFDRLPWINTTNYSSITTKKISSIYLNKQYILNENKLDLDNWGIREDTFPSNLAIFNINNVTCVNNKTIELCFKNEESIVRSFTSGAIYSKEKFLFGRFSVSFCPSNVAGLVSGIFLHRNSPHQEIDMEFLGKDTSKVLLNVFFNPGIEGSKLEYGYRGTPVLLDLGFDASKEFHLYEIEWFSNKIEWYVDGELVYERHIWNPTPIPYLPMEFNINLWHSRSKEFAGQLDNNYLPAKSIIKNVEIVY